MSNISEIKSFPIHYDSENNILKISLPDKIKIEFENNIDIQVLGDFNILTYGMINLLSAFKDINIDSYDAKIYLNSQKCKQLNDFDPNIIPIRTLSNESIDSLIHKQEKILLNLKSCLEQISD